MSLEEEYGEGLNRRYWDYQKKFFPNIKEYFDRSQPTVGRPPVFLKEKEEKNIIVKPDATQDEVVRLFNLVKKRHTHFNSMNSSQALAQSVLGNLAIYNHLDILTDLTDDAGYPLLGRAKLSSENFFMEYEVPHLGEPRPTSLDAFFDGRYQVAIECKYTEKEVGACSRPDLETFASNYKKDHCNGTYTHQRGRNERCPLTENDVKYWKYIPRLFNWQNDTDRVPCPLNRNYQLVRNILAVCVRSNENVTPKNGHMVLIYDSRNPSFQKGGKIFAAVKETQQSLKNPSLLRTCSWQSITEYMKTKGVLPWLTEQLELKYDM